MGREEIIEEYRGSRLTSNKTGGNSLTNLRCPDGRGQRPKETAGRSHLTFQDRRLHKLDCRPYFVNEKSEVLSPSVVSSSL